MAMNEDNRLSFCLGSKISQSASDGITIDDSTGTRYHFQNENECDTLTGTLELMWTHCQESVRYCRLLERTLTDLPGTAFPVIVGRRPFSDGSSGKENLSQKVLVSNMHYLL